MRTGNQCTSSASEGEARGLTTLVAAERGESTGVVGADEVEAAVLATAADRLPSDEGVTGADEPIVALPPCCGLSGARTDK